MTTATIATTMTMMQAVYYEAYGGTSVMKVGPRPKPTTTSDSDADADADAVVIQMHAAGINPVDYKIREGYMKDAWPMELPIITGWDVAGTITEIGAKVTDYKVGDEVYSYNRPAFDDDSHKEGEALIGVDGCAAEFVKVSAWKLARKPTNMNMAEAAAVPLAGLTAHQGIFAVSGGLKEGQTLLILNASGGVGSFAVQFAIDKGVKVVGTCSGRNADFVASLGATVVDYTKKSVIADVKKVAGFEHGADVVFDCVGGEDTKLGIELTKKDTGIIVSIADFGVAEKAKEGGKKGTSFVVSVSGSRLSEITELIEAGKCKTASLEEFPLAEAVKAFEKLEAGRTRGKVVLTN